MPKTKEQLDVDIRYCWDEFKETAPYSAVGPAGRRALITTFFGGLTVGLALAGDAHGAAVAVNIGKELRDACH